MILASGVVQSLLAIDAFSQLVDTAYGRAVLIKLGLLAGIVALGWLNRSRHLPALRAAAAGDAAPGRAGVALRRTLRAELAIAVVVLGDDRSAGRLSRPPRPSRPARSPPTRCSARRASRSRETPLETALAEGKAIGYAGFELGNKFPRTPGAQGQARRVRPGLRFGLVFGRAGAERPVDTRRRSCDAHMDKLRSTASRSWSTAK